MSVVRLRRLQADYQKVQDYVRRQPRVQLIQAEGNPPERYQLRYEIRSIVQKNDDLFESNSHMVEIFLPRNYPRTPPQCRMLTPIFHPNIAPHAICIGDHWSAGESLSAIVARIGELLAYQSYNVKSPLNGEAARWVNDNLDRLPLDVVPMFVDDGPAQAAPAAAMASPPRPAPVSAPPQPVYRPPVAAPAPAPPPAFRAPVPPVPAPAPPAQAMPPAQTPAQDLVCPCPSCGTFLRAPAHLIGKRIRCSRCQNVFTVQQS